MGKITLHIANANHELTDKYISRTKQAIQRVKDEKIFELLGIDHDVDMFLFGLSTKESTTKGVMGYTPNKYEVYLTIGVLSKDSNTNYIFWVLCHELSHIRRYDKQGFGKTLFDNLIFEGLADNFAYQITGTKPLYDKYKDTKKLITIASKHFDDTKYDYQAWFHKGIKDLKIPKLAGYQIGWHIVRDYLERHRFKASDAVLRQARYFRN